MWLLNAETKHLEHFPDDERIFGRYAILSHTWEDDEVTFKDIQQRCAEGKAGYRKIQFTCLQALRDDLQYVWVDTCCIDKKSSAELSEAINSMYRWYYNAHVCYAYLSDVYCGTGDGLHDSAHLRFSRLRDRVSRPRWFSRGWTLQELLAPRVVEFYDSDWTSLGARHQVVEALSNVTRISPEFLRNRDNFRKASIAQKMSWAAGRATTRPEDQAYSLLGIFDVNLPLLYGEGRKAFLRLQEEIVRTQTDHSILVWYSHHGELLAPSPAAFCECDRIVRHITTEEDTFELTSKGLRVSVLARPEMCSSLNGAQDSGRLLAEHENADRILVALSCGYDDASGNGIAIRLQRRPHISTLHRRSRGTGARQEVVYDRLPEITTVTERELLDFMPMDVTISRSPVEPLHISNSRISICHGTTARVESVFPHGEQAVLQKDLVLLPLDTLEGTTTLGCLRVLPQGDSSAITSSAMYLYVQLNQLDGRPHLSLAVKDEGPDEPFLMAVDTFYNPIEQGDKLSLCTTDVWRLHVGARYVLQGGETIWHLDLSGSFFDFPQPINTLEEPISLMATASAEPDLSNTMLPTHVNNEKRDYPPSSPLLPDLLVDILRALIVLVAPDTTRSLQSLVSLITILIPLARHASPCMAQSLRDLDIIQPLATLVKPWLCRLPFASLILQPPHERPRENEIFELPARADVFELPGDEGWIAEAPTEATRGELPAQGKWERIRVDTSSEHSSLECSPTGHLKDSCNIRPAEAPANKVTPVDSSGMANANGPRTFSSQRYDDSPVNGHAASFPWSPTSYDVYCNPWYPPSTAGENIHCSESASPVDPTPDLTPASESESSDEELNHNQDHSTNGIHVKIDSMQQTPTELYSPNDSDLRELLSAVSEQLQTTKNAFLQYERQRRAVVGQWEKHTSLQAGSGGSENHLVLGHTTPIADSLQTKDTSYHRDLFSDWTVF